MVWGRQTHGFIKVPITRHPFFACAWEYGCLPEIPRETGNQTPIFSPVCPPSAKNGCLVPDPPDPSGSRSAGFLAGRGNPIPKYLLEIQAAVGAQLCLDRAFSPWGWQSDRQSNEMGPRVGRFLKRGWQLVTPEDPTRRHEATRIERGQRRGIDPASLIRGQGNPPLKNLPAYP